MKFVVVAALSCAAHVAMAQEQRATARDDLDVTMQIIVDPDAKLPDEVVRKIPLPARTGAAQGTPARARPKPAPAARAEAARELDRGMSERAKERVQDAAQQREQAGRTIAEERRHDPPKPDRPTPPDHPTPPSHP